MESRERRYPLFDDPTVIIFRRDGHPITAGGVAQLFAGRGPQLQARLAFSLFERLVLNKPGNWPDDVSFRPLKPEQILTWITDSAVREQVTVWCKGRGVKLEEDDEERQRPADTRTVIAQEEELVKTLSPHLSQINLARIIAIRRYRQADEKTKNTLISGVYRLLGEYLGPRRYYRRETQIAGPLPLPDLPPELFADQLVSNVLLESEREGVMPIFNRDVEEGFRYFHQLKGVEQHPMKIRFVESLEEYFRNVCQLTVVGLRKEIAGSQKDLPVGADISKSPYPSFHQREYGYRFINKEIGAVDLLIGDTGTMKTGGVIFALEAAGRKATLVICPPSLRDNWEREIKEKYQDPVEVVKIESIEDIHNLINSQNSHPRYIVMGYSQLSTLGVSDHSEDLIKALLTKFSIDSLVADEAHLAKEGQADCTQLLYIVSRNLSPDAARIAMTATGVVNSVEDLDAPVRILLPHRYPNPGDFTRAARNDPHLVAGLLHGQKIMTRWTLEGILGDELPAVSYRDVPVPLSHFHQRLYDFVYLDDTIASQAKRGMLRQVGLEPMLVRRHYHPRKITELISQLEESMHQKQGDRDRELIQEQIKALEARLRRVSNLCSYENAIKQLEEAHEKFMQWKLDQDPEVVFDEDFLVMLGYDDLTLWSYFNLSEGINELIAASQNKLLKQDWEGKNGLFSSKYLKLKEILDSLDPDKCKVIIYSGFYQSYISTGYEDVTEDDELAFFSLYDHLRTWYGENHILKIDGKVTIEPRKGEIADREKVRRNFRLDPRKWLEATIRSSRLGIDLSIPPTKENQQLEKVVIIFLDLPDTYADVIQGIGRVRRKGQQLPIEVIFLKTTNSEQPRTLRYGFIDHGMWEGLEFKRLLSQMILDGVPLTEEEERFIKSHLSSLHVTDLYPTTPGRYMNDVFLRQVRGRGFRENREFLRSKGFEGMTNAEFFAAYYPQYDGFTLAGHNARAISEMIRKSQQGSSMSELRIVSIGAGSGILQRTLGQSVFNIDMIEEVLQVAKERSRKRGHFVCGDATYLPVRSSRSDITDAALILHWTSNMLRLDKNGMTTERIKVLQESNRVTKDGGLVTMTVPYSYLTEDQFRSWMDTLENFFGFRRHSAIPSGLIWATDYRREPVSWVFNLEKIAKPSMELISFQCTSLRAALQFNFESVVAILGPTRSWLSGKDKKVSIAPPLPHREFEVVDPESEETQKYIFKVPDQDQDEIEKIILGELVREIKSELDVLAELGLEEFGFYRRLVKEARGAMGLDKSAAEQLALQVMELWARNGSQRHNSQRIWTELRSYLNENRQGVRQN